MKKEIIQYINENKEWLFDALMETISIDTVNRMTDGNENNGQRLIEKIFKNMGLKIDRFSPDDVIRIKKNPNYLQGRDYSNRDNIVGLIGNGNKKTIIFSSHIDTVPTEELEWKMTEPLSPKRINKRIYGMGAWDMKGGLLCSIFALKTILDLGINIEGKVILESVVDEEFGGANGTLACIEKGYEGDFAIIPEPSSMKICPVGISQNIFDIVIKVSKSGGLGVDDGLEDPIFLAGKIISALSDYEDHLNSLKGGYSLYKDYKKPISFACNAIRAGNMNINALPEVPSSCVFRVVVRNYNDKYDEESFNQMMFDFLNKYKDIKRNIDNSNITFIKRYRFFPGTKHRFDGGNNKKHLDQLIKLSQFVLNKKVKVAGSQFASDMFLFSNYSKTPAIIFGPGGGNEHSADEYVNMEDIVDLSKIFALLIYKHCC